MKSLEITITLISLVKCKLVGFKKKETGITSNQVEKCFEMRLHLMVTK